MFPSKADIQFFFDLGIYNNSDVDFFHDLDYLTDDEREEIIGKQEV
ncbi:XkdX family protein [Enterococcus sp. JM9B]|nr:XkdX family protein [Enterococcus sp. JM9B]